MTRKKSSVRVTVYLPDDLRRHAKEAGLNLSQLLRRAVETELQGDSPMPAVSVERTDDVIEVRVSFPVPHADA